MKIAITAAIAGAVIGAAGAYALLDRQHQSETPRKIVRDIGAVSKMSEADAAAHRAERYADLHTVSETLTLPSRFAQAEALHVLAGRSDSGAVQNLIFEANRIADATLRDASLDVLIARLAELDPASALALARSALFDGNIDIERRVWRSWGHHDLDAAIEAAAMQPSVAQRNLAAQALFHAFGYMGNATTDRIERELGIRPDMTARGRYLYKLADHSVADAIEHINTIPSSRERLDSARWLANHLVRTDALNAAGYAVLFEDRDLREMYERAVASSLAAVDPEAVLDRLVSSYQTDAERAELFGAMRELAARDIDAALQYFDRMKTTRDRRSLQWMITQELARQDPERAIEWAFENERGEWRHLVAQVLGQVARTQPDLAIEAVKRITNSRSRNFAVRQITEALGRTDPIRATAYIATIENRNERSNAAAEFVQEWAQRDPEAAINWVMSSEDVDASEVMRHVGINLTRNNPELAIRLLPSLDDETASQWRRQIAQYLASRNSTAAAQSFISQYEGTEEYAALQAAVVGGVVHNDPMQAKQLADQLPAGAARDSAYSQLISKHAESNPAEAAGWLASIADQRRRDNATRHVARTWHEQDAAAATRWADNLPRGTGRDNAIVGLATQWDELTPDRRLMIDSIGNADKRTQANMSHIQALARKDWQKAQTLANNLELSSSQREEVMRYIDHFRNR